MPSGTPHVRTRRAAVPGGGRNGTVVARATIAVYSYEQFPHPAATAGAVKGSNQAPTAKERRDRTWQSEP